MVVLVLLLLDPGQHFAETLDGPVPRGPWPGWYWRTESGCWARTDYEYGASTFSRISRPMIVISPIDCYGTLLRADFPQPFNLIKFAVYRVPPRGCVDRMARSLRAPPEIPMVSALLLNYARRFRSSCNHRTKKFRTIRYFSTFIC
jgi:hypothetical protein